MCIYIYIYIHIHTYKYMSGPAAGTTSGDPATPGLPECRPPFAVYIKHIYIYIYI